MAPMVELALTVEQELAGIKAELALMRQMLERKDGSSGAARTREAAETPAEGDPFLPPDSRASFALTEG